MMIRLQSQLPLFPVMDHTRKYRAIILPKHIVKLSSNLGFFHSKAGADNIQKIEDRKRAIAAASQNKDLYLGTMLRNTLAEDSLGLFEHRLNLLIESAKEDISAECITAAHEVMIERPDNIRLLAEARFPVYYFLGLKDKSIPYDQIKSEIESVPSANVVVAENTGHMGHIESREAAIQWLAEVCKN